MLKYYNRFMNKKIASVIMVVASVIAVGAAAITINGSDLVYASSSGTSGSAFNSGSSHNRCTAVASGANCVGFTDSGKHTGLLP
jgi:hypothetical protein